MLKETDTSIYITIEVKKETMLREKQEDIGKILDYIFRNAREDIEWEIARLRNPSAWSEFFYEKDRLTTDHSIQ